MAGLYPVAGCKFYIGQVLSDKSTDFVEADFSTQVWQEVDGWTQMGTIGDSGALITTPVINRNRDVKQKGTANAGSMQNVFAQLQSDAGQIALIAAAQPSNKNNYAIKIELNDAVTTTPSKRYFIALVMNAEEPGGAANVIRPLNVTLEINSNIVRTAAS